MSSPANGHPKRKTHDLPSSSPLNAKRPKTNASITSFFGPPKQSAGKAVNGDSSTIAATPKFDKGKWVATLTPEQRSLVKLEIETLDESWLAHLKDEILTPSFLELKRFLKNELDAGKKVFPPMEEVYSWSSHTPLWKVRVVILGQDPYHNHNQAHGLCFSVRPPTLAPPSLKNMYLALANDYPSFVPPPRNSGLLTPWANQGVLMLNTCLTVRAHEAASHQNKGWERFTQKVIDTVAKARTRGVVFLAWGSQAQQRCRSVGTSRHLVLQSVHPSPLSAHRGFLTCGHFKKTNEWLKERYGAEGTIDWNLDKPEPIAAAEVGASVKDTAGQGKDVEEAENKTEPIREEQNGGAAIAAVTEVENEGSAVDDDDDDAIEALEALAQAEVETRKEEKGEVERVS